MLKEGKVNVKYILIVAILATLAGGVILGYWQLIEKEQREMPELAIQKEPEGETDELLNPLDTTDWKAYRDQTYGFEFRYPADWQVKQTEQTGILGLFDKSKASLCDNTCKGNLSQVRLGIDTNSKLLSALEWTEKNISVIGSASDKPITVDSVTGVKRTYFKEGNKIIVVFLVFPQKGKLSPMYFLAASGYENIKIMNQIALEWRFFKINFHYLVCQ